MYELNNLNSLTPFLQNLFSFIVPNISVFVSSVQEARDLVPFFREEAPPFIVTELANTPGSLSQFLEDNKAVLTRWVRSGSTEDLRQSLLRLYEGVQRQLDAENKSLQKTLRYNKIFEDICLKHILEEKKKVSDLENKLKYEKIFKESLQRDMNNHIEAKEKYAVLLTKAMDRNSVLSSHLQKGSDRIDSLKAELFGARQELDARTDQVRVLGAENDELRLQIIKLEEDNALSLVTERGMQHMIDTLELKTAELERMIGPSRAGSSGTNRGRSSGRGHR